MDHPTSTSRPAWTRVVTAGAVLAAVALAALWPLAWARSNGGVDALLGAGADGPARPLLDHEVPGAVRFAGLGHDGQQYYVIARHPISPAASADLLDSPAYRYRRILFPALAGALAPDGGRALVWSLLAVSLAGVALGASATTRLPGAPRWLPLAVGLSPGVGVACALSLADALATGLALAAVAAAVRRRWAWMLVALVAAALTRETLLLVALGLACGPGMGRRLRVATVAAPAVALGAWALWSTEQIGRSAAEGAGQVSLPLLGWLTSTSRAPGLALGLGLIVLVGLGAVRAWDRHRGVSVVLALHAALLLCLADDVTGSWVNTTRVAAPVTALAVWAVVARHVPAERSIEGSSERSAATPTVAAEPALVPIGAS